MFENFDARNLMGIEDRVVIVTGGGKGIGSVYCRRLAEAGARIVVAEIDAEANETIAAEIEAAGGRAVPIATDVGDEAAVIGLTRSLSREVGEFDITVNAITPGFTLSDTQVASSGDYARQNAPDEQKAIKRHQYPEDLVGAVMFLMSDASDFITGQTINVDGGRNMH